MKKNIPFAMLLRAIRYCSSFTLFINERESLRMALLLNKYPEAFIRKQFELVFKRFNISEAVSVYNYERIRSNIITTCYIEARQVDYDKNLFIHFTYCTNMRTFPIRFHALWRKYFSFSPINDINPVLGTRNLPNLQLQLINREDIR